MKVADATTIVVSSDVMEIVPSDPALKQFTDDAGYQQMDETFKELAESGQSLTRLPKREFSRRRVLEAIDEAFELIGGVPRFAFWAHNNPTEFYKLYGKTIPAASQVELMGKIQHQILPALPRPPLAGGDNRSGQTYENDSPSGRPAPESSGGV